MEEILIICKHNFKDLYSTLSSFHYDKDEKPKYTFALHKYIPPPKNEKEYSIDIYINQFKMLQRLVYAKLPPDKEGKYTIENIINLKAKKKKKKQQDNTLQTSSITKDEYPNEHILSFESKFESGNLQLAYHTDHNEYQLFLHNDTNTTGYTQWFFFRVNNTHASHKVTFHIMNLLRKKTKYSYGITIWVYSRKKNINEKIKWHHTNENVQYHPNELYRLSKGKRQYYSTLTFDYTFPYDDDDVYFANCIPFTYTDVMKDLNEYQRHENTKYPYFMRKTLCTTLAGNDLDFITINNTTNHHKGTNISTCVNDSMKEGVVLFARQHPSETVGSWAIKGAIDFLMGNSDEAMYLREHFIFKIIPMMNPDGVISGNTRTSFAGCDLNRRWVNPSDEMHPEIYSTKEMIMNFADKRKIECIVDFHGHFGAFNAFFYANRDKDNYTACKFFPFICNKTSKVINFDKCKFSMPKAKSGTGRIDLFKELNIENVFTIETSNFGCLSGEYANMYFNESSLMEIGRDVCLSIMKMHYAKKKDITKIFNNSISSKIKERIRNDVEHIEHEFLQFVNKKTAKDVNEDEEDKQGVKNKNNDETSSPKGEDVQGNNNNEEDIFDDNGEDDDENSESEPSVDNIDENEIKKLLPLGKKNKRFKRFPKGKRTRLFHKNAESNLTKKYLQDQPQITSRQQLNKTQLTLPQLKTQNTSGNNNNKQTLLTISTINNSTSSKQNTFSLQQLTQKQSSSQNSQVNTKQNNKNVNEQQPTDNNTSQSIIKKSTQLVPIAPKKETVIMNSCLLVKVDNYTQTEEIFFKMHWSYFIGSFPVIAVKYESYASPGRKQRSNNYNYLTDRNDMPNNFNMTIHKRMIMQRKAYNNMFNYIAQNNGRIDYSQMQHNMNGHNISNNKHNKNLGLYALANGTILVNKIPKQKHPNNGSNSNNNNNNNGGSLLHSFNLLNPGNNANNNLKK